MLTGAGPVPPEAGAPLGKLTAWLEWHARYSSTKEQREEIEFLQDLEAKGKLKERPPAITSRPVLGFADYMAFKVWMDARRGAAEGFSGPSLSWTEIEAWQRMRRFGDDGETALEIVLACEDAARRGRALGQADAEEKGK